MFIRMTYIDLRQIQNKNQNDKTIDQSNTYSSLDRRDRTWKINSEKNNKTSLIRNKSQSIIKQKRKNLNIKKITDK